MKAKKLKGFSLIEVVIAASILTVTVFGVYKLIAENSRLMKNASDYKQGNMLFISLKECIENLGFDNFKASTQTGYSFNFGPADNLCLTGSYDTNYSYSGVTIGQNIYYLYGGITNSGSDLGGNFIDWNIGIYNENIGKIEKTFKDYK